MASSQPPAIAASKSTNNSPQLSPAPSQAGASGGDSFGQRRPGGSGSFGAGAASRASLSPRNNQNARKQNKGSKKFRHVDEDAIAESAAMRSTNSRKGQTSITHLMQFSLPPRPQNNHHHRLNFGHGRYNRRTPHWGLGSGYHAVDKARYVHANYRFIVDPRADYHPQSVDADLHLDWNNVLQILVSSQSQNADCPICLETPVAPRMARCGHIFCLSCLIRFMHANEEANVPEKRSRSKSCPICGDNVRLSEARPVRWYVGHENKPPREGDDVVLRLIMRQSGSTLALPRDGADALAKDEDIPWHFAAEVMDYARVMKGSEDYMMEQMDADITAIETQAQHDEVMFGEDYEVEWTRRAVKIIRDSKEKISGIGNPPAMLNKPVETKPKRAPIDYSNDNAPDMYYVQHAAKSGQSSSEGAATPQTDVSTTATTENSSAPTSEHALPTNPKPRTLSATSSGSHPTSALTTSLAQFKARQTHGHQPPSEYYFYQALLHYYLSPLDIRILKTAFGDFSSFPSTILPRVERVSSGHIVDDDLRRHKKWLGHLPYGCEVGFLECDWTDTVPPEVLKQFKPEIEKRRKANSDKEIRDEKARIRAEKEEEEKRYASVRRRRASLTERFNANDFQPLVASQVADAAEAVDGDMASSPPWPSRRQGSSFATLASPSTSPSAPRTVWGTAAVPGASPILQASQVPHDGEDGWLQGWEKDLLQEEDSLVAEAQTMPLSGESSKAGTSSGPKGGKKKKAKKITLMSTNARRGA